MHKQTLTPARNEAIVIPTPLGLITLQRIRGKKWEIRLPGGLRAFKDEKRAVSESPYLLEQNGIIVPGFSILLPDVDTETGELVGVKIPGNQPLRLRKIGEKNNGRGNTTADKLEKLASSKGRVDRGHADHEPYRLELPVG